MTIKKYSFFSPLKDNGPNYRKKEAIITIFYTKAFSNLTKAY